MSEQALTLDDHFTIDKKDVSRAAGLLPEDYRLDDELKPIEQLVEAFEECGVCASVSDGGIVSLCEDDCFDPDMLDDVFAAIAPAVKGGSRFIYGWHDDRPTVPYGFFFDHGVCEFKAGRIVFD